MLRQRVEGTEGFPKITNPFLGVPIMRIIVYGGLYGGTPVWGNSYIVQKKAQRTSKNLHRNLFVLEYIPNRHLDS